MKSPWVFFKFYYIRVMTFEVMNQEKICVVFYIVNATRIFRHRTYSDRHLYSRQWAEAHSLQQGLTIKFHMTESVNGIQTILFGSTLPYTTQLESFKSSLIYFVPKTIMSLSLHTHFVAFNLDWAFLLDLEARQAKHTKV